MGNKKLLLIINPCSGKNSKRVGALEIMNRLSSDNFDFNVRTTRCQGDATTIVKDLGSDYDVVVCCGGDGTLNETINGLMRIDKQIPVGYIPSGSTNDLAATLGIPLNAADATSFILSGKKNYYDLGKFNDRYFTYIASFGAATDISYTTPQKLKNIFGHAAYNIYGYGIRLIPMLMNIKPIKMKIEHDNGVVEGNIYFGAFSNSTAVAGTFKYDKLGVKLNDGLFELLLVKDLKSNFEALTLLGKLIRQDYNDPRLVFLKSRKLKITCEEKIPWTLDGEFGGNHGDVEIEVVHDAFKIYSDNEKLFLNNNKFD